MSEDILHLEEQSNHARKLFYFSEYRRLVPEILASEFPLRDGESGDSRRKSIQPAGDQAQYIASIERSEDDRHRPEADREINYSLKEILISRALSEFGEFSDEYGAVKFSRPIGYFAEGNRRCSLFFYEEAAGRPDRKVDFLSRAFAYFVMIHNGILHKEGPKDFIPIKKRSENILFVTDFEHCEFLPRSRIGLTVDVTLYNLPRFDTRSRNTLQAGFKKVFAMPVTERRMLLIDELSEASSSLAERLRPMLDEWGYFKGHIREVGSAFDTITRVNTLVSTETG